MNGLAGNLLCRPVPPRRARGCARASSTSSSSSFVSSASRRKIRPTRNGTVVRVLYAAGFSDTSRNHTWFGTGPGYVAGLKHKQISTPGLETNVKHSPSHRVVYGYAHRTPVASVQIIFSLKPRTPTIISPTIRR